MRPLAAALAALVLGAPAASARPDEATGEATGTRPDGRGRLTLPASGLQIVLPRQARTGVQAFGRVAFTAEGPAISDEIATSAMALSVTFEGQDCDAFDTLDGAKTGLDYKGSRWSRAMNPRAGSRDAPRTVAYCHRGLIVLVHGERGVDLDAGWLDAFAKGLARGVRGPLSDRAVFVEDPQQPDRLAPFPVTRRFRLGGVGLDLTTRLPLEPALHDTRDHFRVYLPAAAQLTVTLAPWPREAPCRAPRRGWPIDKAGALRGCAPTAAGELAVEVSGRAAADTKRDLLKRLSAELGEATPSP